VDGRERVVLDQLPLSPLVLAGPGTRQPGLDILTGRAAGVARREQVSIDGLARSQRPRQSRAMQQIWQRCKVMWLMAHRRTSAIGRGKV
jgi:hypothetical protein